ncbi:hypothetical protein JHK84_040644 [Glycine max]|nr:hypothetical protein JHK85_041019 [Glycine max]KAG5122304.1 hypothetical protein JHK84_040644 [Glycine max]
MAARNDLRFRKVTTTTIVIQFAATSIMSFHLLLYSGLSHSRPTVSFPLLLENFVVQCKLESAGEVESCKRCNCKKSKCLKLISPIGASSRFSIFRPVNGLLLCPSSFFSGESAMGSFDKALIAYIVPGCGMAKDELFDMLDVKSHLSQSHETWKQEIARSQSQVDMRQRVDDLVEETTRQKERDAENEEELSRVLVQIQHVPSAVITKFVMLCTKNQVLVQMQHVPSSVNALKFYANVQPNIRCKWLVYFYLLRVYMIASTVVFII